MDIISVLIKRLYTLGLIDDDIYKTVLDKTVLNSLPNFLLEKGKEAACEPDENTG